MLSALLGTSAASLWLTAGTVKPSTLTFQSTTSQNTFLQYGMNPATHNPHLWGDLQSWQANVKGFPAYEDTYDAQANMVFATTEIFTHPQAKGAAKFSSGVGTLEAINAGTGAVKWSVPLANFGMDAPVYKGNVVLAGYGDGLLVSQNGHYVRNTGKSGVVAVNWRTGAVLWHHSTVGASMPTFAIVGNTAYLADGNHYLNGWNLSTGQRVVHQKLPG
ncbi:MAG: PQQ-binding-like beta-propeller repeat protein, partial [Firmicutes bacterium]|nr:PQQ-binding-like beta-propeller repeat protein [Bacillota bacterium]